MLKPRAGDNDRFVPLRTGRNASDFDAGLLRQKFQVVLRALGQVLLASETACWRVPARECLIDRLKRFHSLECRRHFLAAAVSDADGNLVELIQHVQLGDHQAIEAVDHCSVAQERHIEPAAAARTSSDGSILVAGLANLLSVGIVELRRKRTAANASDVCLRDADHSVDAGRGDSGAGTSTTGRSARRGNKGVGAMINIEHAPLGALKQHLVSGSHRRMQQLSRIADHGTDFARKGQVFVANLSVVDGLLDMKRLREQLLIFSQRIVEEAEARGLVKVGDADAAASGFILIAWSDSPRSGADGYAIMPAFGHLLNG